MPGRRVAAFAASLALAAVATSRADIPVVELDGVTVRVYYSGKAAADGAVTALGVQAATEDAAGARE